MLGYLAARTTHVALGSAVLNIYSRSPAALAQTAAGLGLGVSGPQVVEGFHGVAYDRLLARNEEVVATIRAVFRHDAVSLAGRRVRLP